MSPHRAFSVGDSSLDETSIAYIAAPGSRSSISVKPHFSSTRLDARFAGSVPPVSVRIIGRVRDQSIRPDTNSVAGPRPHELSANRYPIRRSTPGPGSGASPRMRRPTGRSNTVSTMSDVEESASGFSIQALAVSAECWPRHDSGIATVVRDVNISETTSARSTSNRSATTCQGPTLSRSVRNSHTSDPSSLTLPLCHRRTRCLPRRRTTGFARGDCRRRHGSSRASDRPPEKRLSAQLFFGHVTVVSARP